MTRQIVENMAAIILSVTMLFASSIAFAGSGEISAGENSKSTKPSPTTQKVEIKAELWGLTWADDLKTAGEKLKQRGFVVTGQEESHGQTRASFKKGTFSGYGCTLEMSGDRRGLTYLRILLEPMSEEKGRVVYKEMVDNFTGSYGPVQKSNASHLKSIPGAFIQSAAWTHSQKDGPVFEAVITKEESQPGYWDDDPTVVGKVSMIFRLPKEEKPDDGEPLWL
jgi:hypothetical protein